MLEDTNEYKSEEEFLAHYNPNEFDKPSVTTDIIMFSVSSKEQENYRKTNEKTMSILLIKRKSYPFKNKWCVPGGFLNIDENLEECPKRILTEETNIKNVYLEQLYTFGDVNRDPRMRILSVGYMALVDKKNIKEELVENASWFDIKTSENGNKINVELDNGKEKLHFKAKKHTDTMSNKYKFEIIENESIAFDHALVIINGLERIKNKIEYTDIVFSMMPKYFTLGELQQVYEVILNKKLLAAAFRRIIAYKVEKTKFVKKGEGHRPSVLFTYKRK